MYSVSKCAYIHVKQLWSFFHKLFLKCTYLHFLLKFTIYSLILRFIYNAKKSTFKNRNCLNVRNSRNIFASEFQHLKTFWDFFSSIRGNRSNISGENVKTSFAELFLKFRQTIWIPFFYFRAYKKVFLSFNQLVSLTFFKWEILIGNCVIGYVNKWRHAIKRSTIFVMFLKAFKK